MLSRAPAPVRKLHVLLYSRVSSFFIRVPNFQTWHIFMKFETYTYCHQRKISKTWSVIKDHNPSQEPSCPPKLQQNFIILQVGSRYLQTWQIFINLETYSYCHQRKSWSSETLSKSSDAVRSSSNYFKTLIFISFLMDLRILRMLKNFSFPFCADFFCKIFG